MYEKKSTQQLYYKQRDEKNNNRLDRSTGPSRPAAALLPSASPWLYASHMASPIDLTHSAHEATPRHIILNSHMPNTHTHALPSS